MMPMMMLVDSNHEMEDGPNSVYVTSESTLRNMSTVPIYIDDFEVSYQWDEEPSISFQAVAYHDELADIEIEIEGTNSIVQPGEEFTLIYDANIEKISPENMDYPFINSLMIMNTI